MIVFLDAARAACHTCFNRELRDLLPKSLIEIQSLLEVNGARYLRQHLQRETRLLPPRLFCSAGLPTHPHGHGVAPAYLYGEHLEGTAIGYRDIFGQPNERNDCACARDGSYKGELLAVIR